MREANRDAIRGVLEQTPPELSADIIDKGVATGDTGYIWKHGLLMLAADWFTEDQCRQMMWDAPSRLLDW